MPNITINLSEGRTWKLNPMNYFLFPPISNQTTQEFGFYGLTYNPNITSYKDKNYTPEEKANFK